MVDYERGNDHSEIEMSEDMKFTKKGKRKGGKVHRVFVAGKLKQMKADRNVLVIDENLDSRRVESFDLPKFSVSLMSKHILLTPVKVS